MIARLMRSRSTSEASINAGPSLTQLRRRARTCGPKSDRRIANRLATAENLSLEGIGSDSLARATN
jgi:hypothetical protein